MKTAGVVMNLVDAFANFAWMFGASGSSPIPHPWVIGPALKFTIMLVDFMFLGTVLPHHVLMTVAQGTLLTNGLCDAGVMTDMTCTYAAKIPPYVMPVAILLYAALIYNFKGANLDVLAQLAGSLSLVGSVFCSLGFIPLEPVCALFAKVKEPAVFLPRCMIFGNAIRTLRNLLDTDEFDEDEDD